MAKTILQLPLKDSALDGSGRLTPPWEKFFQLIKKMLDPLGVEETVTLNNNQVAAADVEGLRFDSDKVKEARIEYFVQRVTTGGGAVELTESGTLHCVWQPTSSSWSLSQGDFYPEDAGITFSITAAGKVQYTTTNITGTASISKLSFRVRTMVG